MGDPTKVSDQELNHLAEWAASQVRGSASSAIRDDEPSPKTPPPAPVPPLVPDFPHKETINEHVNHFSEVIGHPVSGSTHFHGAIGIAIPTLLILLAITIATGPSITGFVAYSVPTTMIIDSTFSESTNITLQLHDAPTTLSATGSFNGKGVIRHSGTRRAISQTITQLTEPSPIDQTPFTGSCIQTCEKRDYTSTLDGNFHNVTIEILLDPNTSVYLDSISYTYTPANHAPAFNRRLTNLSARAGKPLEIDLSGYTTDADNDSITYISTTSLLADIKTAGNLLTITPRGNATGAARFVIYASDQQSISSMNVTLHVRSDLTEDDLIAANAPFTIDPEIVEDIRILDGTPVIIEFESPHQALGASAAATEIWSTTTEALDSTDSLDVTVKRSFEHIPAVAATLTEEGLGDLLTNPAVKAIYADELFTVSLTEELKVIAATSNDRTTPSGTTLNGAGQTACLIDTGVQSSHPDLSGKILSGHNAMKPGTTSEDDNGHGTAMAGILVSSQGITPSSRIYPIKACDLTGSCRTSHILAALDACIDAAQEHNITTIIGSFGDGKPHTRSDCPHVFDNAITTAQHAGITFAFASGNTGYFDGINYPACDERTISVGASTLNNTIATFSNTGERLDILAPGENVLTTMIGGGHASTSGTSISTPFAAGAAMILNEAGHMQGLTLGPDRIKELLINNGDPVGKYRRLNVKKAIASLYPPPIQPERVNGSQTNATIVSEPSTNATPSDTGLEPSTPDHHPSKITPTFISSTGKTSTLVRDALVTGGSARVIIEVNTSPFGAPEFSIASTTGLPLESEGSDGESTSGQETPPNGAASKEALRAAIRAAQDAALKDLRTSPGGFATLSTDDDLAFEWRIENLPYMTATITAQGLSKLENNPAVASITFDRVRELLPTIVELNDGETSNRSAQTSFDISIPTIGGVFARDNLNFTGLGVKVAIIDSGIDYTHPDLGACTTSEFLAGSCAKVPIGFNFCNGTTCGRDPDALDHFGHGTHIAGIIGGTGLGGLKGIAPNTTFMAIASCNATGACPDSSVIAGIDFAISRGADIISMSLGANQIPNDGRDALGVVASQAVNLYGIPVIAAAGNAGPGTGSVATPAAGPGVLSVAASSDAGTTIVSDDTIALFSNRGPFAFGRFGPDIAAPGVNINSAAPPLSQCPFTTALCSNTRFKVGSGTSFATPHVTGVAALLKEQNMSATPKLIRTRIMNTAVGIAGDTFAKGSGLLNATGALTAIFQATINGAEKGHLEALPGSYVEFNTTIDIRGDDPHTIIIQSEDITEPDGNSSIGRGNFSSHFKLDGSQFGRIRVPDGQKPGTYRSNLNYTILSDPMSARVPYTLVIPIPENGFVQSRMGDGSSSTKTGDVLYYKIVTPNATNFSVILAWPDSNNDLDLYLFSEGGLLLATSATLNDPEIITANGAQEKSYWLAVHGFTVPAAGTEFNITTNASGDLAIEPSSLQISALANQTKTFTIALRNGPKPKNVSIALTRLQTGSSISTIRNVPASGTDFFSIPRNGINLSGIKTCDANITWSGTSLDLDLSYFSSSNGGTTNTTRDPKSSNDNSQLNRSIESITDQDIEFFGTFFREWGIRILNRNNSAILANLTIVCRNLLAGPETTSTPDTITTLNQSQEVNVTLTINASQLTPGSIIEYQLRIRENETRLAGSIPVTVTVVAPPQPTISPTSFNGATTDLLTTQDITDIQNMTVEIVGRGRIQWPGRVDARSANLTKTIRIGPQFIAVNTTGLDRSFNTSANLTMTNVTCANFHLFTSPGFLTKDGVTSTGFTCDTGSNPSCTSIRCIDGTLTFQTNHFSSYAVLLGVSNTSSINGSFLSDSELSGSNVSGANITFSNLTGSSVKNSSIFRSTLTNSTIDNITSANSSIFHSYLNGSTMNNSNARNATVTKTRMENSTIENATIRNATMIQTHLNRSVVENATLSRSTIDDSFINNTQINGSSILNASIIFSKSINSSIQNTTVRNASISAGTIDRAAIENATLTGTNASDAVINASQVNRSGITNSTLLRVNAILLTAIDSFIDPSNVSNSTVNNSFVEDSRIDNSTVFDSNATNSTINASLLSLADIRNSSVRGSRIHNTSFADAFIENLTISNGLNLSCGQTLIGDINLSTDVLSATTCYIVGADQITINCNGYRLASASSAPLINITGRHGVRVLNCGLFGAGSALLLSNSNNSFISNLSLGEATIDISGVSTNNTFYGLANASDYNFGPSASHSTLANATGDTLTIQGFGINVTNSSINSTIAISGENSTVTFTTVSSPTDAFSLSGYGHLIANNTVTGNIGFGSISSSRFSDNNVTGGCLGTTSTVSRDDITISGNRIASCASGGTGINFEPASNTNFTITNNTILSSSNSLTITGGDQWTILANTFNASGPIRITSSSAILFANNTINAPTETVAVDLSNLSTVSIRETIISNGTGTASIALRLASTVENGTLSGVTISNNTIDGFYRCISASSGENYPQRINGTQIHGNLFSSCGKSIDLEANSTGSSGNGIILSHNQILSSNNGILLNSLSNSNIESTRINATGNISISITNSRNISITNATITTAKIGAILTNTSRPTLKDLIIVNITNEAVILNSSNAGTLINLTLNSSSTSILVSGGLNHTINQTNAHAPVIIENVSVSKLNFTSEVNFSLNQPISAFVNLSNNSVTINASNSPQFNITSIITLNVSITEAFPGIDVEQDGTFQPCPSTICATIGQEGSLFVFNVTSFTSYNALSTTTGSVIINSTVNGSAVQNSTIINSTVTNSTINFTIITNSTVDNSTIINSSVLNSGIDNATILNSTAHGAHVNSSTLVITQARNSTVKTSTLNRSSIENSTVSFANLTGSFSNNSLILNTSALASNITRTTINLSVINTTLASNSSIERSNATESVIDNSSIHLSSSRRSTVNTSLIDLGSLTNSSVVRSRLNTSTIDNTTASRTNLTGTYLNTSTVSTTHLDNISAIRSNISGSSMINWSAFNSTITTARLNSGRTDNSTLTITNATSSTINSSQVDRSGIENTTIQGSFLNGTQTDNSTIFSSSVSSTTLNTSIITDSTVTNGTIRRSISNQSTSTETGLSNATILLSEANRSRIDNTSMARSNISASLINRSIADDSTILNSTILDSAMNSTDIQNSSTHETIASNTTIAGSSIDFATILNTSIERGRINETYLLNSTITNATLDSTIINSSTIEDSGVSASNLTQSKLNHTLIGNTTADGMNATNATILSSVIANSSLNFSTIINSNLTNVTTHNSTIFGETIINDVIINDRSLLSCGKIIGRNGILDQNIACEGRGIIINATNRSVDCQGNTITGNNTAIGIEIRSLPNTTIRSCALSNFTVGITINATNATTLTSVVSQNALIGLLVINSTNITISNTSSTGNSIAGAIIDPADNITIENSTFSGGANALLLLETNNSRIAYNLIENASRGLNLTSSFNNLIRNNTIKNTSINLVITSGNGNRVFFNNFSDAKSLHILSGLGNTFNTTILGAIAGNEYDNIRILRIYDQDSNGFGERGIDFPYNSTNNGTVNINVTDFGPLTTKSDTAPIQTGQLGNQSYTSGQTDTSIDLDGIFQDNDGDPLNFTIAGNQSIGVRINASNNVIIITVPANFTGTETVTFIANDTILATNLTINLVVTAPAVAETPPSNPSVSGQGAAAAAPSAAEAPAAAAPAAAEAPAAAAPAAAAPAAPAAPSSAASPQALNLPTPAATETISKVRGVPMACGYRSKTTLEKEVIPQTTTLKDVQLPEGFAMAIDPFNITCTNDTLDFTLNIPAGFTELKALRCQKGLCEANIETEVTSEELVCGGKTISEIRREQIVKRKEFLKPEEIGLITEEGLVISTGKRAIISGKNKVEFPKDIKKPFRASIGSPKTEVPLPKNPSANIIGTPLDIILHDAQGPLPAKVTIPFIVPEYYDAQSFTIFARSADDWIYLENSVRDDAQKTITVELDDLLKYVDNGVAEFAIIGAGCSACETAKLVKIHTPPGARTALIMIHGFASSPKTWQFLIDDISLTNQPYQIYTFEYSTSQPVEKTTKEFMDLLELQSSQFDEIYILAHSLGGFIAQEGLYLSNQQKGTYTWLPKVKKAVLIGSPNDGTPGAKAYQELFKNLVNEQSEFSLFNVNSEVVRELSEGLQRPRVQGIDYYVIAGTKTYEFNLGAFAITTGEILNLTHTNDGITTTRSAQHVGGAYINDSCKNYYEINITHTDLIDHPLARRVVERIIGEDQFKKTGNAIGYNQYLRMKVEKCDESDQFAIIGKPVPPGEEAAPLNCNCGNGRCGIGESPATCPQDCGLAVVRPAAEVATEVVTYFAVTLFLIFVLYRALKILRRREHGETPPVQRKEETPGETALKVEIIGDASIQEMAAKPQPPQHRPGYESLSASEKLKADLSDLQGDLDRILEDKKREPHFFPPALLDELNDIKTLVEPRKKSTPQSGQQPRLSLKDTKELRERLDELKKKYPLAGKKSRDSTARATSLKTTITRSLGTIGEELTRMLSGRPPPREEPLTRKGSRPDTDHGIKRSKGQTRAPAPIEKDSLRLGLSSEEKDRILRLLDGTKLSAPLGTTKKSTLREQEAQRLRTERTRRASTKLSSIIKGELNDLLDDTTHLLEGAIKRKSTRAKRTLAASPSPVKNLAKERTQPTTILPPKKPARAVNQTRTLIATPKPVVQLKPAKPVKKPSATLGAELAGLVSDATKLLDLTKTAPPKKKPRTKARRTP